MVVGLDFRFIGQCLKIAGSGYGYKSKETTELFKIICENNLKNSVDGWKRI